MTTFQIIGIVVVALLGLAIFYCIYDISFRKDKKNRKNKKHENRE